MRGVKPLAGVLIASMLLTACAGSRTPDIAEGVGDPGAGDKVRYEAAASHADGADGETPDLKDPNDPETYLVDKQRLTAAHHNDAYGHPQAHYHEEPTPEQQAVAETVLLLTASAFLCTFVVVVLDGACNFGAHAGYYY